jgi:hypothetical protein
MNSKLGWLLVALAFAAGGWYHGWQGLLMAFTVTVFWLLLQFGRALRVMKNATEKPVGHVASAVMFQTKLLRHMTMLQVVGLTKSLGLKVTDATGSDADSDTWRWEDASGDSVVLTFNQGKLTTWVLQRAQPDPSPLALPLAVPPAT